MSDTQLVNALERLARVAERIATPLEKSNAAQTEHRTNNYPDELLAKFRKGST